MWRLEIKKCGCALSGGLKWKTANEMGGLCEERFVGIGRGEREMVEVKHDL